MKTVDKGIPVFKNLKGEETRWITKGGGGICGWMRESSVQKCRTNILYYVLMFTLVKLYMIKLIYPVVRTACPSCNF